MSTDISQIVRDKKSNQDMEAIKDALVYLMESQKTETVTEPAKKKGLLDRLLRR